MTVRRSNTSSEDTLRGIVSLDASALIELLSGTKLSVQLNRAIIDDEVQPYASYVSLVESEYILCRAIGGERAREKVEKLIASQAVEIVGDESLIHQVARIKCERSIALGDSYSIALAENLKGSAVFARAEDDLRREMRRKPFPVKLVFLEDKTTPESDSINPKDSIFDIALGRRKPVSLRLKGDALKRARKTSQEVDKAVYDEK